MLALVGIALVGTGYWGLERHSKRARPAVEVTEPLPPTHTKPVAPVDVFESTQVAQTGLRRPAPVAPPPSNGLGKDRYVDLDKGNSGAILERYAGIPAVPSRRQDAVAPLAPTRQLPVSANASRDEQLKVLTASMSQFRNDETPIPRTRVGPGLGYDASVPAADGFHPRLRVVNTDQLTQKTQVRALPPTAPKSMVARPTSAPTAVAQNTAPRFYQRSDAYNSGNANATSSMPTPVLRGNYYESMKETNRETEMPGLKPPTDCEPVSLESSRYGIGAGPAVAAGSEHGPAPTTYSGYDPANMRATDRGWAGLWGSGPSATGAVAAMAQTGWASAVRAQARDSTGLDPERIGQGGPAQPTAPSAPWQGELATQGRELMPSLPVINTAPDTTGAMQSPWHAVAGHAHVRAPHRAEFERSAYQAMPAAQIDAPNSSGLRSAFARGRLATATHREVIDRTALNVPAPHADLGVVARPRWQTFALRDATSVVNGSADSGSASGGVGRAAGPNRPNAFASSDFINGAVAPERALAVPRPEFMHDRMPNIGPRGGMAYMAPAGVQYNPNKFEGLDDRLDVAIDSQRTIGPSPVRAA